jgi:hypothetical protein
MVDRGFGQKTNLTYRVETNYPDTSYPEGENKFGSYYAYAYTDVRDPGNNQKKRLVNTQKELFDKRVDVDKLHFFEAEDAIAVAKFLQEYGRLCSGWDNSSQEKYQKKRRGPLKVRVVEVYETNTRTNIEFEHSKPYVEIIMRRNF